jgi:hypothetical protein
MGHKENIGQNALLGKARENWGDPAKVSCRNLLRPLHNTVLETMNGPKPTIGSDAAVKLVLAVALLAIVTSGSSQPVLTLQPISQSVSLAASATFRVAAPALTRRFTFNGGWQVQTCSPARTLPSH